MDKFIEKITFQSDHVTHMIEIHRCLLTAQKNPNSCPPSPGFPQQSSHPLLYFSLTFSQTSWFFYVLKIPLLLFLPSRSLLLIVPLFGRLFFRFSGLSPFQLSFFKQNHHFFRKALQDHPIQSFLSQLPSKCAIHLFF